MREKKHERKCRGTSRGMGRNVKKSHGEAGKDRKPFSQGRGNRKRPFCGRQQNGFRPEARESGKRQGIEAGQPGRTGEKHKRFGISGLFKKNKGSNRSGSRQTEETEKKPSKTGETGQTPVCFLSAGAGKWGEGEEKAPCRRAWRKAGYGA